jgi:hypothetical protein
MARTEDRAPEEDLQEDAKATAAKTRELHRSA